MLSQSLILALGLPLGTAAETVLGVYLYSRHGDRTAKQPSTPRLTDLGYQEAFTSGGFYRQRYVSSNATSPILGISHDTFRYSQLAASAPFDNVLMPSALGFLQGLYPPVGGALGSENLRNSTNITAPLGGYQVIPVQTAATGGNSESSAWLQGSSGCANAIASSNEYFSSPEYNQLYSSTLNFYQNYTDLTNGTFTAAQMNYKNAYNIYDLFYVAGIHNASFDPSNVINNDNLFQLRTLADQHEFNLAYNASSPVRAIAGSTLAAQIVQALNTTITNKGASKFNIQFGAYGTFQSFFGLAKLPAADPVFYGVPDYTSSMVFELVTNANSTTFPNSTDDISVRFYFHNGTTSATSEPTVYPLFGQESTLLSWKDFTAGMNSFAIGNQSAWCTACGNSTGVCAPGGDSATSQSSNVAGSSSGSHLSNAVAGVIGAMVTLGVILGLELLVILIGGFRLVSKKRLNATQNGVPNGTKA